MILDWGTVVRIRDIIAIAIDVINVIAYMYIHRHLNAIALAHKLHTYARVVRTEHDYTSMRTCSTTTRPSIVPYIHAVWDVVLTRRSCTRVGGLWWAICQ